jgi:hypothetical protein
MRRAILSVAVALLAAAAVTASGWALQVAALPAPKPAARIAADASTWLHDYRFVVDVFHFDHRRTKGACLRGWFGRPRGPKAHGSLLSFESGPVVRAPRRGHVTVVKGHPGRLMPIKLAVAAGCTGKLDGALVAAAQGTAHLTASRGYAANRPAVALRWSRGRDYDLTLYVSPRTDRPLVAILEVAGRYATARLYLARARRNLLERFHLPVPRPQF